MRWSIRWRCTRAIRASGWRASCSPSRRSATSRPSSSPAACSPCTTSIARAGSSAGWRSWPRRSSAPGRSSSRCPTRTSISPSNDQRDFITFILVGNGAVDGRRRDPVASSRPKVLSGSALSRLFHARSNGFGSATPDVAAGSAGRPIKIGPAEVELPGHRPDPDRRLAVPLPPRADDPRARACAGSRSSACSRCVILLAFAPVRRVRPNGQMFFLGAGFMLLETKGVVHMALLFGSTWMVNSIVFFAILTMILLSNLYVLAVRPRRLWPYYALLILALAINAAVPMDVFLSLPGASKVVASCLLVFLPVFFAGVIFATAFRRAARSPTSISARTSAGSSWGA